MLYDCHYSAQQAQHGLDLCALHHFLSDTEVRVHDASGAPWFTLPMHRLILGAASLHFRQLLTRKTTLQAIDVQFDPQATPEPLVRLFFRLFYVTVFDEAHMGAQDQALVGENVFQLYELAWQYLFDPLRAHCERLLYSTFALDHFKPLSDYALRPVAPGRFRIQDERLGLYARFLQWFQCCTDDNNTHYTELQASPRHSQSSGSDDDEEARGAMTIDRQYFSCNKREIMDELQCTVENIAQCRVPRCHVAPQQDGARLVEYYRRVCSECMRRGNRATRDNTYSNIGSLRKRYSNGQELYSFRLKRERHTHTHALELCVDRQLEPRAKRVHYDEEVMQVDEATLDALEDGAHDAYACSAELTLLSRRLCLTQYSAQHARCATAQYETLVRFDLDARDECYTGRCQSCRHSGPLYILLVRLSLVRLKTESPPVLPVYGASPL